MIIKPTKKTLRAILTPNNNKFSNSFHKQLSVQQKVMKY